MAFKNTQIALDTALNTVGLDIPIVWEGVEYKQVKGTAYARVTNLTSISNVLDLENSIQDNLGIYQIDVFYPQDGSGTGEMLDIIDDIYTYFKSNLTLTVSSQNVYIRDISRLPITDAADGKGFRVGGVTISYTSHF